MKTLKELVGRPGQILSVMHFPTAGLARTMESAGAEAGFIGTAGVVGNVTGMADLGQITMTEVLQVSGWIARSVNVPVIMDGDTGHGSIMAVRRMIKEAIQAGVSGIRIDDRAIEVDKNEATGMGSVVGADYAVTRFRAAVDMREEMGRPDFFIIAQTDAREAPNGSLEDALHRMELYEATGIDIIQWRHPRDVDEVRSGSRPPQGPLRLHADEGRRQPAPGGADGAGLRHGLVPRLHPNRNHQGCLRVRRRLPKARHRSLGRLPERSIPAARRSTRSKRAPSASTSCRSATSASRPEQRIRHGGTRWTRHWNASSATHAASLR